MNGGVALVTGAAQGIGAAVVRGLVRAGARVAALDRQADQLAVMIAGLEGAGEVAPHAVDVRDAAAVVRAVTAIEAQLGPIDRLVSAAGVLHKGDQVALGAIGGREGWEACLAANATGVRNVSTAVAECMVPRRAGVIVTVASNAAHTPRMGMASYAASKAAAVAFTKCLGLELAGHGIRCNVVSPGSTDTPMQRSLWPRDQDAPAAIAGVVAGDAGRHKLGIPLGSIAAPADVAEAVLFLLSERSRHITMHELCVDGGATLGR